MPGNNGKSDNLAGAVSEVSDRVSNLIREEIELAKVEVGRKATSLLKGTIAIVAGAVFGVFAIVIGLEAAAWGLDAILVQGAGDIWLGFLIVFGVLAILAVLAFATATRLLKRGAPPTPTMAIDEAKRIRETVAAKSEAESRLVSETAVSQSQGER
ncbi:MAG: phage holin family protein [Solirubrobacterales bacterium]|nr:phage holin family protein [Solirubrobacterales bacterium]